MKRRKNIIDSSLLIKFMDISDGGNHFRNFMNNGEIFFGNIGKYRKLETENGNKGIGDFKDGKIIFTKRELKQWDINFVAGDSNLTYKDWDCDMDSIALELTPNAATFCCTYLSMTHNLINDKRKKRFINGINESLLNDDRYPKKVILIRYPEQFVDKLQNAVHKDNKKIITGPIIYDNDKMGATMRLDKQLNQKSFDFSDALTFIKDESFKKQQEFRFMVRTNENSDYKINIGSLKDIAFPFDSLEECLDSIDLTLRKF